MQFYILCLALDNGQGLWVGQGSRVKRRGADTWKNNGQEL